MYEDTKVHSYMYKPMQICSSSF